MHVLAGVGVGKVVLAEQILAVVVAIGCPDHAVHMLARDLVGVRGELGEVGGTLVVELDQDHGTVDAVVEHAIRLGAADPGEPGLPDVPLDFLHLHASMTVVHIADVQLARSSR